MKFRQFAKIPLRVTAAFALLAFSLQTPALAQFQQRLGVICQTNFGTCQIAPAPVGSLCYCGRTVGFVR